MAFLALLIFPLYPHIRRTLHPLEDSVFLCLRSDTGSPHLNKARQGYHEGLMKPDFLKERVAALI